MAAIEELLTENLSLRIGMIRVQIQTVTPSVARWHRQKQAHCRHLVATKVIYLPLCVRKKKKLKLETGADFTC